MGGIIEDNNLRERTFVFEDRKQAGKVLGEKLIKYKETKPWILAIPAGGTPIGLELSKKLDCRFDLVIVRKIHIPWNPEAGFGSMTWNGKVFFNESLLNRLNLSQEEIDNQLEIEKREIEKRMEKFRGGELFPDLNGETVILSDDGMASGFSMLAAVNTVKKDDPEKIVVAVPTGSESSVERISPKVDELICLNIRSGPRFAVASAYEKWHDLSDEDVIKLLKKSKYYQPEI